MSIDWPLAVNGATLLVITATAIAALVQLRHLRVNNQLQGLLTILRMPYDPALREANEFVMIRASCLIHQVPLNRRGPIFRQQLARAVLDFAGACNRHLPASAGPIAYSNFEWLVARGRNWNERHPDGNYPKETARLALSDPWLVYDKPEECASLPSA